RDHHRFGRPDADRVGDRLSGHEWSALMAYDRRYTPPTAARYAASARAGTRTFWHQRVTSVAGIPLTIAFIAIVIALLGRNHAGTVQIIGSPLVAILMILFILTTAYHMWIGMQEIIIDYVHAPAPKYLALFGNMFFCAVTGLASIYAIIKLIVGV